MKNLSQLKLIRYGKGVFGDVVFEFGAFGVGAVKTFFALILKA